ncbi:MAG: 2TM domain-containing protein [Thermomicrobiales bacterium]
MASQHRADREEPGAAKIALLLHVGLSASVVIALAVINALVDRSTWWVLWVAWAWGMVVALHAGATFRWRGWFGANAMVTALFCAGIVGTNLALGGGSWWPWVVVAAVAPLVGHGLIAVRGVPLLAAQTVTSGILFGEVVVANVLHPSDRWDAGLSIAGSMLALCVLMLCTLILTGRRDS